MDQCTFRKGSWLTFGVLAVFSRGLSGWGSLLAGESYTEWLLPVTFAFLWGSLALFGFLGAVFTPPPDKREKFTIYQWGMVMVFIAIPIAGLLFISMGYDPLSVGVDIVAAPLILALWIYLERRDQEKQPNQVA